MTKSRTLKLWGGIFIVVVVLLAVYNFLSVRGEGEYSVVYLSSGELYVGRLSTFPRLRLSDAYMFQAAPDPTDPSKTTFQLGPLTEALWAPQYLYLNPDHVLFSGPLSETSKVFQALKNPARSDSPIQQGASTSTER